MILTGNNQRVWGNTCPISCLFTANSTRWYSSCIRVVYLLLVFTETQERYVILETVLFSTAATSCYCMVCCRTECLFCFKYFKMFRKNDRLRKLMLINYVHIHNYNKIPLKYQLLSSLSRSFVLWNCAKLVHQLAKKYFWHDYLMDYFKVKLTIFIWTKGPVIISVIRTGGVKCLTGYIKVKVKQSH